MACVLLEREAWRLHKLLSHVTDYACGQKFSFSRCLEIAPLTLEINKLKNERDFVILAHFYCLPEIVYGVADFRGDSYALAKTAREVKQKNIIFAGVSFMAQTAKIINPQKEVFLPPVFAGCSLADSISAGDVKRLKQKYPSAPVLCYINSTAEVKAHCDICVTSLNVFDIAAKLPQEELIFVPDVYMAQNIENDLKARGLKKKIISFGGTCCVHDKYNAQAVMEIRQKYPEAKILCHPECSPAVCALCDYTGGTGGMLQYVKGQSAQTFAVLSERGIINCLEFENPSKTFLPVGRLCAQMKRNSLENILEVLKNPKARQAARVNVEAQTAQEAKRAIDNMFKHAGGSVK